MSDNIKINSINLFINKFDDTHAIINLDTLKENFYLDDDEEGFYKLSLYEKKTFGSETVNDNYNRPPIGPIEKGLYCSFCGKEGPDDHSESCDFPEQNSLNLTMEGVNNYIIKDTNYKGDYIDFKNRFLGGTLNQALLNDLLLNPDDIILSNGSFDININKNALTNISFLGIYKKRGPQKLASKTSTSQFLNNVIISYEKNGNKTSIRISKNGLINLINIPKIATELNIIIDNLVERINESGAVEISKFQEASKTDLNQYTFLKQFSYIHSTTAQFRISNIIKDAEINFEELDTMLSPFDASGKVVGGDYTTVERTSSGDTIINFQGLKIIEWEYSLGRLTRSEVMTKEYIKVVSIPSPGLKLTAIFNKYGTVIMTLSRCSNKQMFKGLCGDVFTPISDALFIPFVQKFDELFTKEKNSLIKKSLSSESISAKTEFNTVTGYAPSGKICRLTRTREAGDKTYKEGMRPDPYSWTGKCPDPNYQYLKPEGVQDKDGLWYPCCEAKSRDSVEKMKRYLLNGFPLNESNGRQFDIIDGVDSGSGIIKPGSNSLGASAEVYIDGKLEDVTVIKKLSKKSNEYIVRLQSGKNVNIKGTDFKRDSRIFPGLKDLTREKLINCVTKNLTKNNNLIDSGGKIIKNNRSEFNEKFSSEQYEIFVSLVGETDRYYLSYYTMQKFKERPHYLFGAPINSYPFYLVLSPRGNFYISPDYNFLESDISENFNDTTVLFGYLQFNDSEFKKEMLVMDVLYHNISFRDLSFNDRFSKLLEIQNELFTSIIDEIIVIPDFYDDIISGSQQVSDVGDKLVFIKEDCCGFISWGDLDPFDDIITVQILNKDRQTIRFGYDGRPFPSGIGIDFLNNFAFNKRDIPEKLNNFEYFKIKINRDVDGDIVPNRKISIMDTSEKLITYEKTVEILTLKFSPLKSEFFEDPDEWVLPTETLKYNGIKLISI